MYIVRRLTVLLGLTLLIAVVVAGDAATAQAQGRIEVEAFTGRPFGVGRITLDLTPDMLPEPLGSEGVGVTERQGRVLYPAIDNPAFGKLMRQVLDSDSRLTTGGPIREEVGGILRGVLDRPPRTTIYFLFRGSEPLDIVLQTRVNVPIRVTPRNFPQGQWRLQQLWWRQYARPAGPLEPKTDYPPLLDTYLASTLARRLNLRLPEKRQTKSAQDELNHEIGLNLGTETLRMSMLQDRVLGLNNWSEPADLPLPQALEPAPLQMPEIAKDVKIEPIALRVPAECFYVRFGSFANFLWLQDTLAKWGGDAANLIALRGLDRGMNTRIESQLILKQTVLSRMLGDTVIADVAFVGTDMFFREGAAYGLLFQAKNNLALSASFSQQRSERLAAGGVKEERLKFGDQTVSFISSPDGEVRSYYVTSGDYHFFTTSKYLVTRFLAAAAGERSLGASADFRHARSLMPIDRGDTIWLYVSDAFFRNITSPHYRVEMARRLQATADIELVQMAKLASAAEDRPGGTIDELIAAQVLPQDFGPLPDGSRTVLDGGKVYDSLRGYRGSFVPVPDVPVEKVTRAEAADYARFARYYLENWGRMDPIVAGVKRTALKNNQEQVVVDVLASPFAPEHFRTLRRHIGLASDQQLAAIPGDMAALDLVLDNQRVFAGLRDVGAPNRGGVLGRFPLGRIRDFLVGYIGTTGELGVLSVLNIAIPPFSDPEGYAMSPVGGWRRQYGPFTVFSFQREVLDFVVPQLRFEPAARPAQVRLRVQDLANAQVTPALNNLAYARTRETTLNNVRFMHQLDQQLHVPPASCLEAAEFLLDGKLIDPLGGKYELKSPADAPAYWTSTAIQPGEASGIGQVRAPEGFVAPPLNWFRGLDLDAAMTEKSISAHAEVIMQMPSKPKAK